MTLKELQRQLSDLSTPDKATAIQILTRTLNNNSQGITKTIGVIGGDACIANKWMRLIKLIVGFGVRLRSPR